MDIVTSSVFSPGPPPGKAYLEQILILQSPGILAVADAGSAGPEGRAALRIALDAVRGHVSRNEDILERFKRNPAPELRERILQVIEESFTRAARELYAFARRYKGLTVTMDVALLLNSEAFVGHVGDGRVYLVRRGLVHQLTVDHARASNEPGAETKTKVRALGPQPSVRVESLCMELTEGDRFVLCTRTVHGVLHEQVLHRHIVGESLDGLGPALIKAAGDAPMVAAAAQLGGGEASQPGSGRSRLAILAPMPLFSHCSERELRAIASATHPRRFAGETVLFKKGDPGTDLYLVISGRIRIEVDGKPIVTLGPGSNFGEMAMLDEPQRSADAIAVEEAECLLISRDSFFALLKGNPKLAVKILWNMLLRLSARLRSTSSRLTELTEAVEKSVEAAPAAPPAALDDETQQDLEFQRLVREQQEQLKE